MVEYHAPELLNIFHKIIVDNKNYCYLCLRSEDERRLVIPVAFQRFVSAVKAKTNGPIFFVCHICEKQAANALKVFQATSIASTLSLILSGLRKRDLQNNRVMFNQRLYNKILRNNDLCDTLTPIRLYEQLLRVRKTSGLVETETLVMDTKGVFEAGSLIELPKCSDQNMNQDAIIECPIRPAQATTPTILPDLTPAHNIDTNPPPDTCIVIVDDDPLKTPPNLPLPNVPQPVPSIPQPVPTIPQPVPTIPQPVPTIPQPVPTIPLSVIPTAQLLQPSNLYNNLVVTINPPQIVKFQELLQQPQIPTVNCILHPIILDVSGNFSVPSIPGIIINGNLITYQEKVIRSQRPLGVDMDIVRQNLLSNNEVFIQNVDTNKPVNDSCQTEESCQPKKMKTDDRNDAVVENVKNQNSSFCIKKRNTRRRNFMKTIKISDISSGVGALTTDNNKNLVDKTDWEDKIPMDVISFVDAVDPNPSGVLFRNRKAPSPLNKEVALPTQVATLPMQEPAGSLKPNPIEAEIIDLC